MQVSIEQIAAFVAAAETGSFSAAGRRLHKAQSAISQCIANLEASCGTALFDRTSRSPKLTEAGQHLLKDAQSTLAAYQRVIGHAHALQRGQEQQLQVYVTPLLSNKELRPLWQRFSQAFSAVSLRLLQQLPQGAMAGADIIISEQNLLHAEHYNSYPLASQPLLAVMSSACHTRPTRQLCLSRQLQLSSQGSELWLADSANQLGPWLQDGLGWGYLPLSLAQPLLARGQLQYIQDPDIPQERHLPLTLYVSHQQIGRAGLWLVQQLRQQLALNRSLHADGES